jgi:hypothetical protein
VARARLAGLYVIEARGIDPSPQAIWRAMAATRRLVDFTTGIALDVGDPQAALAQEEEQSCDLLLLPEALAGGGLGAAIARVLDGVAVPIPADARPPGGLSGAAG